MSKTDRISLSEPGMAKFLSGIELRVMEYMWSRSLTATSTEIAAAIGGVKLTTIAPILDRLVASGLLCRTLDESGRRLHYLYSTCCGREAAQRALIDRVAEALVDSFGHVAVAAFSKYVPRGGDGNGAKEADACASPGCSVFSDDSKQKSSPITLVRQGRKMSRGDAA